MTPTQLGLKRSRGLISSAYKNHFLVTFLVVFLCVWLFSRMRDLPGIDSLLLKKLKVCCAKEDSVLPRETGLKLMESTPAEVTYFCFTSFSISCSGINMFPCPLRPKNSSGVSAKCRDSRVEELWGLTTFFGYSTQTFVQAVNLLDRFLTLMKVTKPLAVCNSVTLF